MNRKRRYWFKKHSGTLTESDIEHKKALDSTGYWGKAGAGAIIHCVNTNRFLLGLRSRNVEQPHTWGTFGGAMDKEDPDPYTTALREVVEETGLSKNNIHKNKKLAVYKDSSFSYHNYVIEVLKEFKPVLDWENEQAQWFSLDDIPQPLHFGVSFLLSSPEFKSYISSV